MPRILIAEDEAHILRVMALWLGRHGHEIIETPNGAVALQRLTDESVDLIISDMNMPLVSGLELVRVMRDERGSDVPIMLLTARCDQEKLSAQLGPYRVHLYPKPFVPSRLVHDIDRLLGVAAGPEKGG
jgi:two-component system chemotaxis response regulator CheY